MVRAVLAFCSSTMTDCRLERGSKGQKWPCDPVRLTATGGVSVLQMDDGGFLALEEAV